MKIDGNKVFISSFIYIIQLFFLKDFCFGLWWILENIFDI